MVSRSAVGRRLGVAEGRERARPVDGFCHSWHFVEVEAAEPLGHLRDLASESLGDLGRTDAHDRHLSLEVRVVDPVVQAAALERVVDLARAIPGEDHQRWVRRADRPQLGDADRVVGEDLEQECLELLVGSVDLIDEQHRRHGIVVVDGVEERPAQQEFRSEHVLLGAHTVLALADQPDVEQLARVVPLVCGVRKVDALVALQTDEPGTEARGKRSRRLGLAHPGFAFEEQRLVDAHRHEDRRREAPIAEIIVGGEEVDDRIDRSGRRGIGRCVHEVSVTSSPPGGQAARLRRPTVDHTA